MALIPGTARRALERLVFAGGDYGLTEAIAPLKKSFTPSGALSMLAWLSQWSPSALAARTMALGKAILPPVGEVADVIGVHVRDVDLVDLLGRVARGLEADDELAQRRAKQRAGAGVDQDQLGPVLMR